MTNRSDGRAHWPRLRGLMDRRGSQSRAALPRQALRGGGRFVPRGPAAMAGQRRGGRRGSRYRRGWGPAAGVPALPCSARGCSARARKSSFSAVAAGPPVFPRVPARCAGGPSRAAPVSPARRAAPFPRSEEATSLLPLARTSLGL